MNAPCRDNLCALQKEAWLPGGAVPWAELGCQPCRWLLERGNPIQHSQACSTCWEIWDLLMAADFLPALGRNLCTRCCVGVCRLVLGEASNSPEDCQQCRLEAGAAVQPGEENIPNVPLSASAFGLPVALKSQCSVFLVECGVVLGVECKGTLRNALHTHIPSLHPWWVALEKRQTLVGIMGEGRALQPHFVNPISLVLMQEKLLQCTCSSSGLGKKITQVSLPLSQREAISLPLKWNKCSCY